MQRSFFYCLAIGSLLAGCVTKVIPTASPVDAPVLTRSLGPGLVLEIDPRMELLAAVQAWTSWTTDPRSDGHWSPEPSPYAQELKKVLSAFGDSPAVKQSQDLLKNRGFSYDAPPAFVLAGDRGLAFEPPAKGYSAYLVQRAGSREALDSWAAALRNLAAEAAFPEFFASHRSYYEGLFDRATQGLDAGPLAAWLREYYGFTEETVFHFVLAPTMMPGGGYGTTVVREEGGRKVTHVYQVIRDAERVSGHQLAGLTLHEFGHSFVNPSIGDQIPAAARPGLERLWSPVKDAMRAQAYTNLETFLNELVLRATTIRGQVQIGLESAAGAEVLLNSEVQRGFFPIREVYHELQDYEAHRDRWPRFHDFGPELLNRLANQSEKLLAASTKTRAVGSFRATFEGDGPAPGSPFGLAVGASSQGDGRPSEVLFDTRDPAEGTQCLTLRGQAETSTWQFVSTELEPRRGTIVARFQVKAQDLRREAKQFNNAYAGFLVEGKDGKKRFEVRPFEGTFVWRTEEIRLSVNPDQVRSLQFGMFLSISGELSFDDLSVEWE